MPFSTLVVIVLYLAVPWLPLWGASGSSMVSVQIVGVVVGWISHHLSETRWPLMSGVPRTDAEMDEARRSVRASNRVFILVIAAGALAAHGLFGSGVLLGVVLSVDLGRVLRESLLPLPTPLELEAH